MSFLNFLLIVLICVVFWKIFRQSAEARAEKLAFEKQKTEELARLEEYFKQWPPLRRLYGYAKNCGIGFEIQPAREALDDIFSDSINWACTYFQKAEKIKKGIRILEFCDPQIIVPLDVLVSASRQTVQNYLFLVDNLQDLADSLDKGRDLAALEIMLECTKKLERKIVEINEKSLKSAIFSFGHEIGHWRLAQKDVGSCVTCPLIIEGGTDFHGCLLKELAASVEGLEVLEELDLLECVGREWLLKEGKKTALRQCDHCQAEIEEGRCPAIEEIDEALKRFP